MKQVRLEPPSTLKRLIAFGWVAVVVLIWLCFCDAWVVPVTVARLVPGTVWIGPHFFGVWGRGLLDLFCAAGILATALPVGRVVVEFFTSERGVLASLFAVVVGLWVMAVAVLVAGVISVRAVPVVWVGLLTWVLPGGRWKWSQSKWEKLSGWEWFLVAVLVVAGVLNVIGVVTPPFEYDALEYHLGALSEYARAGRIVFLPHNFYSNLPQLTEMLYLLGLQTCSAGVAKWLHLCFALLTAVALFAVGRRCWSRAVGLTSATLFFCLPFVADLSRTARIDLATTFFGTMAFAGVLLWSRSNEGGWFWLGAAAAGVSVATKWTAVPVVVLPCFILIAAETRYFRLPAIFCLLASVFILPWLVKNFFFAGNPVYPLLDDWFHSSHWGMGQAALFAEKHFARWDASMWRSPWRSLMSEPGASPLVLMVAPLAWLAWRGDRQVRRLAWLVGLAFLGWWALTFRPWRFLLPAVPMALLVGAVGLLVAGRWSRVLVGVVAGMGLCWTLATELVDAEYSERIPPKVSMMEFALGQTGREEFVARVGAGAFEPILWMNTHLPASAKVLYVGEGRVFYAKTPPVWCTAFDRHPLAKVLRMPTDASKMYAGLRAAGVTHVYVNFSEWRRLRENYNYLLGMDAGAFRQMLQDPVYARRIYEHDGKVVWELKVNE
jgi:4-amino-4-deoxy-L-arabinose transferase-like glycosyltransferase